MERTKKKILVHKNREKAGKNGYNDKKKGFGYNDARCPIAKLSNISHHARPDSQTVPTDWQTGYGNDISSFNIPMT